MKFDAEKNAARISLAQSCLRAINADLTPLDLPDDLHGEAKAIRDDFRSALVPLGIAEQRLKTFGARLAARRAEG